MRARMLDRPARCRPKRSTLFPNCSCPRIVRPLRFLAEQGQAMVQRVSTVAFEGIEARAVDVQVQVAPGLPAFNMLGNIVDTGSRQREGADRRLMVSIIRFHGVMTQLLYGQRATPGSRPL
jgi:hypothetical protein